MGDIHFGHKQTIHEDGDVIVLISSIENLKCTLTHSRNGIVSTTLCLPGHRAVNIEDCKIGDEITLAPFTYKDGKVPFFMRKSKKAFTIKALLPHKVLNSFIQEEKIST